MTPYSGFGPVWASETRSNTLWIPFSLEAGDQVQQAVFFATADLLNLEVDLLLYDTTSSYFEMEDDDVERAERAERWAAYGVGPENSIRMASIAS